MHDDVSRRDVGQQQYGRPFGISWGLLKTTVLAGTDGDANVHRSEGFHCPVKRLLINQEYSMKKTQGWRKRAQSAVTYPYVQNAAANAEEREGQLLS